MSCLYRYFHQYQDTHCSPRVEQYSRNLVLIPNITRLGKMLQNYHFLINFNFTCFNLRAFYCCSIHNNLVCFESLQYHSFIGGIHNELLYGRNKFLSHVAGKLHSSKSVGEINFLYLTSNCDWMTMSRNWLCSFEK